jgi:hypothetical protein
MNRLVPFLAFTAAFYELLVGMQFVRLPNAAEGLIVLALLFLGNALLINSLVNFRANKKRIRNAMN